MALPMEILSRPSDLGNEPEKEKPMIHCVSRRLEFS